jgi:alanyl-tRNA synthetase
VRLGEIVEEAPRTERLYLGDAYLRRFQGRVLRASREKKRNIYVVLDRTIFHPKSGGQPSDTGTIYGPGFSMEVKKAMSLRDVIVHWGKLEGEGGVEGTVAGVIDWSVRLRYMKRHTAGHLLDHCISFTTGGHVVTVDSWLADPSYVSYKGSPPSAEHLKRAVDMANKMITRGGDVIVEEVSYPELLRRAPHAPNIFRLPDLDSYRIVSIAGCEPIPCGGTHLNNIRDIRHLSIVRVEERDGSFRLFYDAT